MILKNYDAYSSAMFEITEKEFEKLPTGKCDISSDLFKLRKYFLQRNNFVVKTYHIVGIPKYLKRNNWDSAILLVLCLYDGRIIGKRHNNSQWLSI